MDLARIIQSILRPEGTMVGTTTVKVHPRHEYLIDVETARRERKAFAQALADIPNIESGLSWQLLMPWTGGNGSLAMACIAIGHHLGLWPIYPDPTVHAENYQRRGSMLPISGVIEEWPAWAGVITKPDGAPQTVKTAEEKFEEDKEADPGYDQDELSAYLQKLGT